MITVADDEQWRNLKSDLSSCRFVTNVAVKEYIHKNISLMPIRHELMTSKLSTGDLNSLTTGSTRSLGIKKLTTDSYAPPMINNNDADSRRLEFSKAKSMTKSWRGITNAVPFLFRSYPAGKRLMDDKATFSRNNNHKSLSDLNCDTTIKPRKKAPRRRSSLTAITEQGNFQRSTELQRLESTASLLRMAISAQLNQKTSSQDSSDSSEISPDPCCHDDTKLHKRHPLPHTSSRRLREKNTIQPKTTRTERMMSYATSKQESKEKGSVVDEFDHEPGFFAPQPSTKRRIPRNVTVSNDYEDDISIITTLSDVAQRFPNSDVHKKMAKRMSRMT